MWECQDDNKNQHFQLVGMGMGMTGSQGGGNGNGNDQTQVVQVKVQSSGLCVSVDPMAMGSASNYSLVMAAW